MVDHRGPFKIWRDPVPGAKYLISADVADGLKDGDYSVADVWDASSREQVAQWHGHIIPHDFANTLFLLGCFYNWGLMIPEVNNHGATVCHLLEARKYPNLYYRDDLKRGGTTYGFLTTAQNKERIIDSARAAIRNMAVKINSERTISECRSFIKVSAHRMEAAGESFDDCVMSLAIAMYILDTTVNIPQPVMRQESSDFNTAMGLHDNPARRVFRGYT